MIEFVCGVRIRVMKEEMMKDVMDVRRVGVRVA